MGLVPHPAKTGHFRKTCDAQVFKKILCITLDLFDLTTASQIPSRRVTARARSRKGLGEGHLLPNDVLLVN
jgi:hypothetical protein